MASQATIQFLGDWRHEQHGHIERGGLLRLEYDKGRLPRCFTTWRGAEFGNIVAYIRFHPRGEIFSGSVVAPVRSSENPPGIVVGHTPVALDLAVPSDAMQAEMWFHNFSQTSSRCDAWDSRFGENYWFGVGGARPRNPMKPASYRTGALTRPDMVNVLEQNAATVNVFPRPPQGGPQGGTNLQTMLRVVAWVDERAYGANAWIDVHVFDGRDELIQSETRTLFYAGFGPDFRYEFIGKVYQGATATPGSVQPRPEARKVQYRLYYEVNHQVFTDGVLHQHELPENVPGRWDWPLNQ